MIVDITVENFRSIKSEQVFSMYAEKKPLHHPGNISYIDEKIGILKTTAIYGPNASGKTNLIYAIAALKDIIVESGDLKEGDEIEAYQPYLLSDSTSESASNLEVEFFVNKERYRYQVTYDSHNILFEKLDVFKTIKPSNIFTRDTPDEWKAVKFGDSYKGGRKQFAFFPNNSYLAKAGNSPESPDFIRDIYNYFRRDIITLLTNEKVSLYNWFEKNTYKNVMNAFLKHADLGIDSFEVRQRDIPSDLTLPDDVPESVRRGFLHELSKQEVFFHQSESGALVEFDKDMESRGTNKLFMLIPFLTMVLREGASLFIDEIESSFHPFLAELIIKIFNDPLVNKNNAQLIFTTHDTFLMSQSVLRKDQVYLSTKTHENGSEYICLEEFDSSLKDSSPFAKWYTEGRLGGIPMMDYKEITTALKDALNDA